MHIYIKRERGRERGYVPLRALLVEDAAAALLAADGVAAAQRELEAAVAADVVHRGALEVEGPREAGARAPRARGRVALACGDLVGLARHFVVVVWGSWLGETIALFRCWSSVIVVVLVVCAKRVREYVRYGMVSLYLPPM